MNTAAKVQEYLDSINAGVKVIEFEQDTSTSELAAAALGIKVGAIAKSLLFKAKNGYIMIITAGDTRVDAKRIKALAGSRVRMATPEETLEATGYPVGGVCPFNLASPIPIYIDESLKRFDSIYPAAGNNRSAIPMTFAKLLQITGGRICSVAQIQEDI